MLEKEKCIEKPFIVPIPIAMCKDDGFVWFIDATLGGLFRIDLCIWHIEEIIKASRLYEKAFFKPSAILCINDNLWIIPNNLKDDILIYNKEDNRLIHHNKWQRDVEVGSAVWAKNRIYIIPLCDNKEILCGTIDRDELTEIDLKIFADESVSFLWDFCSSENSIYVPRTQGRGLIQINIDNNSSEDILRDERFVGVCESNGELWTLPRTGHCIKVYDNELTLKNEIDIHTSDRTYDASEYFRILVTMECVVLMPWKDVNPLLIMWRNETCWREIEADCLTTTFDLERLWGLNSPYYFYFSTNEETLEIMPLNHKWISISKKNRLPEYRSLDISDCLTEDEIRKQYKAAGEYVNRNVLSENKDRDIEKLIWLIGS